MGKDDPWGKFKEQVLECLNTGLQRLSLEVPELESSLDIPPSPELGDLTSNVCFSVAKRLKENPHSLAQKIRDEIEPSGLVDGVEACRGYLNFKVKIPLLAQLTSDLIDKLGSKFGSEERKKKVIIEHTSINPTKPLHIGHARNAVLGDCLARIYRKLGYRVEVHNYIDDLGLQMAEILLAWEKVPRPKTKFDHALGLMYVKIQELLQREPSLQGETRRILKELERGKRRTRRMARSIAEACLRANFATTKKLGIKYDLLVWESDILEAGLVDEILSKLKKIGRIEQREGALVLKLADLGLEDKILVRSDGTSLYLTRDIAYQLWKFGKTERALKFKSWFDMFTTHKNGRSSRRFGNADIVINVIGSEQRDMQKAVFATLKLLGFEKEFANSFHLAYEHVELPTGKFSGRKGTWIGYTLDDAVKEAVNRAREIVEQKSPSESERFKQKVSRIIGIGALRFSLLSTAPEKKITFKWEEALNLERNSGPAIQYSHARACSILRKAKKIEQPDWEKLHLQEEKELVKLLARYPETLRASASQLKPNILTRYCSTLSSVFNSFYEKAPVLKAERGLRAARLKLVSCVKTVLADALNLLGIEAPPRI